MMSLIRDLFNLVYPVLCEACGTTLVKGETTICSHCIASLSYTGFHTCDDNPVAKFFWGRVELEKAAAFLQFRKGTRTQKLMHKLKYRGKKEVGIMLGRLYAHQLCQTKWTDGMQLIVSVPLHPLKQKRRGYNQSSMFAMGLEEITRITFSEKVLIRKTYTDTQTKKSRIARWENVSTVFLVRDKNALEGKHVLLVDDIVTTGATLESCARALLEGGAAKVSVATIACTL